MSSASSQAAASANPSETLFVVPFASAMLNADLALLARTLNLSTRVHPKMLPLHDSPGLLRLDHFSGLFLKRGATEGEWSLEAQSWRRPGEQSIHEWHVMAACAARQLDSTVAIPERSHPVLAEIRDLPLGQADNKRLARFRRRLTGLQ